MSRASRKGYDGEIECANVLNDIFEPFGFKFVRFGGQEFNKISAAGDVGLVKFAKIRGVNKTFREPSECILHPFLFDSKAHARAEVAQWFSKVRDDARMWGKVSGILYCIVGLRQRERYWVVSKTVFCKRFPDVVPYKVLGDKAFITTEEFKTIAAYQT